MNERIWTADVYRMAAVSMLRNFGPYGSFEMKGEKWKAWCEAFGLVIGSRDVEVTIRGAMCPKSPWPEGGKIWKPKLMGLAAGLETGWIKPGDLDEMDLAA